MYQLVNPPPEVACSPTDANISRSQSIISQTQSEINTSHSQSEVHISHEQEERLQRIKDVCNKHGLSRKLRPELLHNILVDEARRLMFCYIPKVACSNWKGTLIYTTEKFKSHHKPGDTIAVHAPRSLTKYGIKRLSSYPSYKVKTMIKDYFKFMFVRHPLKRVVSAFRDKFSDHPQSDVGYKAGPRILKKYGGGPFYNGSQIPFEMFLQFIIDEVKDDRHLNPHWKQFTNTCLPCNMDYDFIGHLETLGEDVDTVLPRVTTDPAEQYFPQPGANGPSSIKTENGINTAAKVQSFYHNVSHKQLEAVKQVYAMDCEIFGYECDVWE